MMRLGSMLFAMAVGVGLLAGPLFGSRRLRASWSRPCAVKRQVELTAPDTRVVGNNVVTTMRVKNVSSGPIAGFRIEENWFDRAGNAVPGDVYRHPRPLAGRRGDRNQADDAAQARGWATTATSSRTPTATIKTTVVPKLDLPKPTK